MKAELEKLHGEAGGKILMLTGVRLGLLVDEYHLAFGSLIRVDSNEGGLMQLEPAGQIRRRETQRIDLIFQVNHVGDGSAGADRLPLLHQDAPQPTSDRRPKRVEFQLFIESS